MRNPRVDVYACVVNFVGQSRLDKPVIAIIPLQYSNYADIALEDTLKDLPKHSASNLAINLEGEDILPYQLLYRLSKAELVVLRKHLAEYTARGQI